VVRDIVEKERQRHPRPPFITSTLQQDASNKLGFNAKRTMSVAQRLYEGVELGERGTTALITYMRTDSVRISDEAKDGAREWITRTLGPEFYPKEPRVYKSKGSAQDAHEAIRPTMVEYTPDKLKDHLAKDQLKLYSLIWERFVSCQMTNAKIRSTALDIQAGDGVFRANASKVVEKGFYKVLKLSTTKDDKEILLPEMTVGEVVKVERLTPEQHFTQGPARFTDASIIRTLEEKGIGRPSTYAPIISVLLERYYVTRDSRQLAPTTLGRMINDILVESFPNVVDAAFTAGMEEMLDHVEDERGDWVEAIRDFYGPFKKRVDELMESLESLRGSLDEATDIVCEKCGKPMVKKLGRFGFFLACTGFPECRNTRSIPLAKCPRPGCTGEIVARRKVGGRGREFYGCTRYPECDFITYYKPTHTNCPKCGQFLVERYDKKRGPYKACINPQCDYLHSQEDEHAPED